jgi:hypothetical protein
MLAAPRCVVVASNDYSVSYTAYTPDAHAPLASATWVAAPPAGGRLEARQQACLELCQKLQLSKGMSESTFSSTMWQHA